jgi:hypothetical protein
VSNKVSHEAYRVKTQDTLKEDIQEDAKTEVTGSETKETDTQRAGKMRYGR